MLRVAEEVLATQTARQVNHLLLQDAECSDHEKDNSVWGAGISSGDVQDDLSRVFRFVDSLF